MLNNLFLKVCQSDINLLPKRFSSVFAKKLVYESYGDPAQVVQLVEQELPPPEKGQVLVRMLASAINPADINTIQGVYPVKPSFPAIGGNEGVGEITTVGPGVKSLKVGDLVLPRESAWGTWRSHAVCPENQLLKIPPGVDPVCGATMSVNPCTAYRMLKDFAELTSGDTVIQNGGNSACGQTVIQLCKIWGFPSVSIVRKRPDLDVVKKYLSDLGADYVLTEEEVRTTTLFKDTLKKPKLALNCVGGKNALDMLRHLDHSGYMVTYGGMSRDPVTVPTSALIFKDINIRGFWMTRWNKENLGSSEHAVMVTEIASLFKNQKIKPPAHELVGIERYKDILGRAMAVGGMAGKKFIFNFQ